MDDEKILRMFEIVYGHASDSSGYAEVVCEDDGYTPCGVAWIQDGFVTCEVDLTELMFSYITKDWDEG